MIETFKTNFKNYPPESTVSKEALDEALDDGALAGNRRSLFVYLYFFLE